jgi:23S rRNA (guanosine2251-2'-O)-methyltransferase
MERHRRGRGKQRLLGSHQKCWIWGRNAVLETLRAGRWRILDLYLSDRLEAALLHRTEADAARAAVPVRRLTPERLKQLCHTEEHQGFLARMPEYPYAAEEELLAGAQPVQALYVVLDGVQDPYNLGAILRSAEVFGVNGVFLGARGGTGVTGMVVRSSAGAVNRLRIARVAETAQTVARLRAAGIAAIGASAKAAAPLTAVDLRRAAALVIGNEGAGISDAVAAQCTRLARIPQWGAVGSLNAAAAAAICLYEARRQRLDETPEA